MLPSITNTVCRFRKRKFVNSVVLLFGNAVIFSAYASTDVETIFNEYTNGKFATPQLIQKLTQRPLEEVTRVSAGLYRDVAASEYVKYAIASVLADLEFWRTCDGLELTLDIVRSNSLSVTEALNSLYLMPESERIMCWSK
jgi:hypothetical protein